MLGHKNSRGTKHRFLTLMYLTCFILSLAPTVIAPPERGLSQGQPEMQQAMDNMVAHGVLVKKDYRLPKTDVDYPALLTSKTSLLLAEAENVLNTLPNSKEKQWVQGFVNRMKAIATMLEQTAQKSKQNLQTNRNLESGTPVPRGLSEQPTWPAASAVPGFNPFQKENRMMSKFPVTSPELSHVLSANEYPTERQVVTKPVMLSSKTEDDNDELVRELQSLHQEITPRVFFHTSTMLNQAPDITSPATPESSMPKDIGVINPNVEAEKAKIKTKLIEEIARFHRLGGVIPDDVINALHEVSKMKAGFKTLSLSIASNQNLKAEGNEFESMNDHMMDKEAMQELSDQNKNKQISRTNYEKQSSEGNVPYQAQNQFPNIKSNHSFPNNQLKFYPNQSTLPKQAGNFPQQASYSIMEGTFPETYKNQNLQKPNPFNIYGTYANSYPKHQHINHIPDIIKQKIYESHHKDYSDYLAKHGYGSYPYMHQNNKNSTLDQLPMMVSPYITKPLINHQIDTQLNDEMKRQLRDGKIVVLSDSLVRSNFETNQPDKSGENQTSKPKSEIENVNNSTYIPN